VSEVRIKAEPRTEFGKGAARRVRRSGQVPGVIYGHGADPTHVALPGHELMLALKTANVLLQVNLEGTKFLTLPKSVQRDPVRQVLEHIDLVIVRSGEKVTVDVPITLTGRVVGGIVELNVAAVSVEAEATHIPTEIVVDIDGHEVGSVIRASELVLAVGTTLSADPEQIIVTIAAPAAEEEEEPEAPADETGDAEAVDES
jgi:large subunit ribosomal protein L25